MEPAVVLATTIHPLASEAVNRSHNMEVQLPLYLEKELVAMGVFSDPKLSQQDELETCYEVDFSFRNPDLDEDGEVKF